MDGGGQTRIGRTVWIGELLGASASERPPRLPRPRLVVPEDSVTKANREARRWTVGAMTVREPGPHDWTDGFMLPAYRQALEAKHGRVARWYPLDDVQIVALMRSGQVLLVRGVWDEVMQRTQLVVEAARRPDAEQRIAP